MAASLDAPILKEVGEAARALDALHKEIGKIAARLPDSVPPAKAQAAAKKVHLYLKRYAPVTKVIGSKVHDALSPDTQDGLKWVADTITELLATEAALRKASKVADMDFAKDPEGVMKAIKVAAKEASNPSWVPSTLARIEKEIKLDDDKKKRTEALVKVMQKGQEFGGVVGTSVSSLALLLLLHMIWKLMGTKLKSKPKT
ncbi:MAG: hypothetical protein ABI832_11130 [bacterium]